MNTPDLIVLLQKYRDMHKDIGFKDEEIPPYNMTIEQERELAIWVNENARYVKSPAGLGSPMLLFGVKLLKHNQWSQESCQHEWAGNLYQITHCKKCGKNYE